VHLYAKRPKFDDAEAYIQKFTDVFKMSGVKSVTVVTMEVPCCNGLLAMVKQAAAASTRKVPVKHVVIGIQGGIKSEDWA